MLERVAVHFLDGPGSFCEVFDVRGDRSSIEDVTVLDEISKALVL